MPVDEFDWLFDYVLQFLESDKFDASVMDFVDEKCDVFDNDEENKFIYTTIHEEFREHLEALIISNLGELSITMDMFLDAMEKGRNNRDINTIVFERLTAIDDFLTFKRMMVKRNVELQVEALRSYQSTKLGRFQDDHDDEREINEQFTDQLPEPEELRIQKENELEELENEDALLEEEMEEILQSSLLEMELLHRREELEQADLEAALALSLSIEEERIRMLRIEAKKTADEGEGLEVTGTSVAEAKSTPRANANLESPSKSSSKEISDDYKPPSPTRQTSQNRPAHVKPLDSQSSININNLPDPKPLRGKELKPLPSITKLSAEFEDRKRQAEELLRSNAEQIAAKRQLEEELRQQMKKISTGNKMSDEQLEMEKRARHMREQRDKIIAAKKAEREAKVREEEERNRQSGKTASMPSFVAAAFASSSGKDAKSCTTLVTVEDESETRRGALRMALAQRLKMDLIESEEQKLVKNQEEQFADLDRQLHQVEQLRKENRQRELVLAEQVKRQQNAIARSKNASKATA